MTSIHPIEKKPIGKKRASTDFNLLISRLERQVIHEENRAGCIQILKNKEIWKALDVEKQLKWANLAQMAGGVDIACDVLSHVNQTEPEIVEAWKDHLSLLSILGEKEKMVQVLSRSRKFISEKLHHQWLKLFSVSDRPVPDTDIQAAFLPFETLRYRKQAIGRFLELFSGREDCFARQWVNKTENRQGYVPVRRSLEHQDLEDHFKGLKTYGIYFMKSDGRVKTAAIDVDLRQHYRQKGLKTDDRRLIKRELSYLVERITELSEQAGLWPLVEFSGGKGYHFWFFYESPVKPNLARSSLDRIKQVIAGDLSAFSMEIFPKQDHLKGKGLGNLVKLPLGVHRLTGKRSYFVKCRDRSIEAQLDFLSKIKLAIPETLTMAENDPGEKKVFIHPRWEKWAKSYPELFALESKCPPLAQIIAACRNSKDISVREEKIIFQTIGFLPGAKKLIHYLMKWLADYNTHLVDFKLSRVRGTPLGCKRIHSLMNFSGDLCRFDKSADYAHPLLHLEAWENSPVIKSEKVENLSDALGNLQAAIMQTRRFLK